MRTMKKSKMICAAVLTGVLGAAALAGCAQEMADTGATYNPGEPPLMTASHEGGDVSTHEVDGPRAECITCHPVAQE